MKISQLVRILEDVFPPAECMAGDNIGLQVGDPEGVVRGVVTALDADEDSVRAAVKRRANVIVAHHPIWWKAPRLLPATQAAGAGARAALAAGVAVLSAHTNADFADGGLCDAMAVALELRAVEPLRVEGRSRIGRIGDADGAPWTRWRARVAAEWGPGVRWAGVPPARVRRVAVCSGSGSDLLQDAADRGADVLVTGDVKYHAARDAEFLGRRRARSRKGGGFVLVDAGHFETERGFARLAAALLRSRLGGIRVAAWEPKGPFHLV